MTEPNDALARILDALDEDLETAPGRLRSRPEFRAARALLKELRAEADALTADPARAADRVREAEAQRDLLALARDEEEQAQSAEDALKRDMRQQDERLLAHVSAELKLYWLMIGLAFGIPILLIMPLGMWCALGIVPAGYGLSRMVKATAEMQGRTWVVFMDDVREIETKVRFAHIMAASSGVLVGLWLVFALFLRQVEGG